MGQVRAHGGCLLLVAKPIVGMKWKIPDPPFQACQYQAVAVLLRMPGAWLSAHNG